MTEDQQHGDQLKRGLRNRYIQLIALGGAIDARLLLGSASIIQSAGPGIILGYVVVGFITLSIMHRSGEMVVEKSVVGSFSHFAYKYWGGFVGFSSGQNYWVLYVLVIMAELTAVGKYTQFRYPEVPTRVSAAAFLALINAINLANAKVFGEMELWFIIIKIIAVVAVILSGGRLLPSGNDGPRVSINDLWDQGGLLPHGFTDLVMMMTTIVLSLGRLELVGATATEADNLGQSIPKMTNQVIYRILIFYVGSLAVLLSLMPWTRVTVDTSPFALIFHELGDTSVVNTLNIVALTTTLSIYNNCVYCNSRILFGLAQQGNIPKALMSVGKRDVSMNTILVSALVTAPCVLVNYPTPESVFGLLVALVVSALVINWAMINPAHIKFHKTKQQQDATTRFPVLLYPLGNWVCLTFMVVVLVIMLVTPNMAISVYLIPIWTVILGIGYLCKQKATDAAKAH